MPIDTRRSRRVSGAVRLAMMCCALVWAVSCRVHFIADYDQVLDASATNLSTKISSFIGKMELAAGTPQGSYEQNKAFYSEAGGEIRTLKLRAEQQPKSSLVAKIIDTIGDSLEKLRLLHEESGDKGLTQEKGRPALAAFEVEFKSLFTLETALRRGE